MPKVKPLTKSQQQKDDIKCAGSCLVRAIKKNMIIKGVESLKQLNKDLEPNICCYATFTDRMRSPERLLFSDVVLMLQYLKVPDNEILEIMKGKKNNV